MTYFIVMIILCLICLYGNRYIERKEKEHEKKMQCCCNVDPEQTPGDKIKSAFSACGAKFAGKDFRIETEKILPVSKIHVPMPPCKTPFREPRPFPPIPEFVTDDEIRFHAYMIASADNFQKDSKEYWLEAEKQLKGN